MICCGGQFSCRAPVGVDLLELETPDRLDGRPSLFGGVVVNSQLPYHSRWTGWSVLVLWDDPERWKMKLPLGSPDAFIN